jgi:hypothetical protein
MGKDVYLTWTREKYVYTVNRPDSHVAATPRRPEGIRVQNSNLILLSTQTVLRSASPTMV